jgi:hypothetical protein
MAAPSSVYTISCVAKMLGEPEDWLDERNRPTTTVLDSMLIRTVERSALSSGGVVVKLIGDDPWQQLVDAIDGMLCDASDDVAQVGLRIKAIQFGGSNQCVNSGPAFAAAVGTEVQEVFRPSATARKARSAALLSISTAPSSTYSVSAAH